MIPEQAQLSFAEPAVTQLREPLDRLIERLDGDWRIVVERWRASMVGRALIAHVDGRVAAGARVFPADVFRALHVTPLDRTRVVILGQDPYHGAGQAEGLAFSVPVGQPVPPSLRNIFKELRSDLGVAIPPHGHLGAWARTGVLLLNTSLTVEEGQAGSHAKRGWEALTDDLILAAASNPSPTVFMLWGNHAQAKKPLIEGASTRHLVLACNHPSPLAAMRPPVPFLGSRHFSQALGFLSSHPDGVNCLPAFHGNSTA